MFTLNKEGENYLQSCTILPLEENVHTGTACVIVASVFPVNVPDLWLGCE